MLTAYRAWWSLSLAVLVGAACAGSEGTDETAANPCNPCAANPCAAGDMIDASLVTQGDRELNAGELSAADLVARGEALWNDQSLSNAGNLACSTCHANNQQFQATFAQAYPHNVAMAEQRAGLAQVTAAEMVQVCMVVPMQAAPLDWNSVELAALSAYVESIQGGFDASMVSGANPCNPCGANPCNPCGQ